MQPGRYGSDPAYSGPWPTAPPPSIGQALTGGVALGLGQLIGIVGAAAGDELAGAPIIASVSHGDLPGVVTNAKAQAKDDPGGLKAADRMDKVTAEYDPTGLLHGIFEGYKDAIVLAHHSYDEHPDDHLIPGINLGGG